jgi:hypothetical protein
MTFILLENMLIITYNFPCFPYSPTCSSPPEMLSQIEEPFFHADPAMLKTIGLKTLRDIFT